MVRAVEAKSGATIAFGFITSLIAFGQATGERYPHLRTELRLIHGGEQGGRRNDVDLIPWEDIHTFEW